MLPDSLLAEALCRRNRNLALRLRSRDNTDGCRVSSRKTVRRGLLIARRTSTCRAGTEDFGRVEAVVLRVAGDRLRVLEPPGRFPERVRFLLRIEFDLLSYCFFGFPFCELPVCVFFVVTEVSQSFFM